MRIVRALNDKELEQISNGSKVYVELAKEFKSTDYENYGKEHFLFLIRRQSIHGNR